LSSSSAKVIAAKTEDCDMCRLEQAALMLPSLATSHT